MTRSLDRPRHWGSTLVTLLPALTLAALCWLVTPTRALAAVLDEPESLTEGSDTIVRLHFDVRVQYQRHVPTGSADLVEVYFQILGSDQTLATATEEQVKTPEHDRVPAVTVNYPVQPAAPVKKIIVRFSRKVAFRVRAGPTNQSIDIVFPGLAGVAPRVSGAAGSVERDRYAITLQTVPLDQQDKLRNVPGRFQDYTVFTTRGWRGGTAVVELDLGYFDTKAEADKVRQSALRDFPEATVFDAIARKEETLAKVAEGAAAAPPPAPAPPSPPPIVIPPVPTAVPEVSPPMTAAAPEGEAPDTDLDKQARTLLERARAALASGNNEVAINALNQLLLLPPNKFSQEAQELIGVARERAGETEQARKEYELYLKLFPTGEGATRVRQRLASLAPPPSQESSAATTAATTPVVSPKWGVNGSLSQYYYGGKTQVNTTFLNTPTTANQQSLTSTSQSSLVSTLDLSGRYRDENNDARLILRDTSDKSFIGGATPGTNRLDSAYIDYRNTSYGFSAKVGRQSGVTGGLIGRFDGAILGYDLSPKWRVNVTGGIPTDTLVNSRQNFEGVNVEAQNLWDHWSGDAFFMNQMADGVTDRRAIGGDLRYFDSVRTVYAMMDYDVIFRTLNAATLQGTWQLPDQTSLSVLVDVRKAPELLTSNALIPFGATSLTQLLQGDPALGIPALSLDQIREEAKAITANSKQASFSVSRPFWTKWQASFDVRLTNVGPLPFIVVPSAVAGVSNTLPAQPGTGNVYTYDFQVSGTNLYSLRDINSFTFSHLNGPQFTGNQFSYSNLTGLLQNRVTIEPSLRYYTEDDVSGTKLTRISPALRATYKVLKHLSIESQLLYERSKTTGPTQQDKTNNTFYYIGYRYDLQ